MFGVGWTEMLLIGIVALVVIGPKDLPVVMNRLGKVVASIRRMGSEFQREINKTTGLDTITDLRRSITEPIKQTAAELTREFNKPLPNGSVEPSGAIAPKTPGAESVVDEINEKIGLSSAGTGPLAAPLMTGSKGVESPAPVEAIAPATKLVRKPRARKAAPVPDTGPVEEASPARRRAAKASMAGEQNAPAAPRKPRPRKPKAEA